MLNGVFDTVNLAIPHIRAGGRGGAIVITSSRPRASIAAWLTETQG
jgi:NAD(P)-dependent dehydrogenase (short-subunit alcohol dehydrogenase family)